MTDAEYQRIAQSTLGRLEATVDRWLQDELPSRFDGRILAIDTAVADAWGRAMARAQGAGRPLGAMDAFLAATAEVHGLTLVSRNAPEFEALGSAILNPWTRP